MVNQTQKEYSVVIPFGYKKREKIEVIQKEIVQKLGYASNIVIDGKRKYTDYLVEE